MQWRRWGLAWALSAVMLGTAGAAPLTAQVVGRDPAFPNAWRIRLGTGQTSHRNDLFRIDHAGKPRGECVVISPSGSDAIVILLEGFHGAPDAGDPAVMVGHLTPHRASAPASPQR